jgi:hypothetical protein
MRTAKALVLTTIALLALPAATSAEKFTGQSRQGKLVLLWTQPNDEVRKFGIRWKTDDCTPEGRMGTRWTGFIKPFDRSEPGRFEDHGSYEVDYSDADVRFVTSVWGKQRSDRRWVGRFKIKAFIDRPDGSSNTCRAETKWSASARR